MAAKTDRVTRVRRSRRTQTPTDVLKDTDNVKILDYVRRFPEATVSEIGKAVGLKREATQKRFNRLLAINALRRQVVVDLDALGFTNRFRVDMKIDLARQKARVLPGLPNTGNLYKQVALRLMTEFNTASVIIEDVSLVLGNAADLSASVRTREHQDAIVNFVTKELAKISVANTNTCIEPWSISQDRDLRKAVKEYWQNKPLTEEYAKSPRVKRAGP